MSQAPSPADGPDADRETPSRRRLRRVSPTRFAVYRAVLEASQDAVAILDPTGAVEYTNGNGFAFLHWDRGEAVQGRPWTEMWPEEHRLEVARTIGRAAAGEVSRLRAALAGPDGSSRWWDTVMSPIREDDGVVIGLLATSFDVTDQIETQSFLDNIVEYVPAALFAKDARNGRFVMLNLAAEDLFGLPREEMLGRTAAELFPAERARAAVARDAEVIASGRVQAIEEPIERPDGGVRFFRTRRMATYGDDGPRHLIGVAEDVTDQRAAAETLKTAAERAEAANRAKSEFLANMSHEIRTPLNGVVGVADVLARTDLSGSQRDMVEIIRSSGATLDRLLSDVLDLARMESGRIEVEAEPFHLGEALRSVAGLLGMRAQEKGIALELELVPDVERRVVGDIVRVKQILTNLISNAVKFTDRGEVRLVVARDARTPDGFRFEVRDTGVGFDPAQKDRVFGRFQQADGSITRRFGGTGLGLAISRQLAELMGGCLECDSRPGEGSVFTVVLPLQPAPEKTGVDIASSEAPREHDLAPDEARPLRILLADDHPTNRKVVELILDQLGVDMVSVEDGQQAVAAFRAGVFDLVLMDMQMPVMDGLSATREIRALERAAQAPATPLFMLTANAHAEHIEAGRAAGADRHLTKPITADKLIAALMELEERAGGRNAA